MRKLRKVLMFLALFLSMVAPVAAQQGRRLFTTTTPTPDVGFTLVGSGITVHQITWQVSGTITTCTVALDSSPDGVTWTPGGIIGNQTCTSNGQSAFLTANVNFFRINPTVLTGGGTLNVTYTGFMLVSNPSGVNATQVQGPGATGAPVVGNPVYIATKDANGNLRTIQTDTNGGVAGAGGVFLGSGANFLGSDGNPASAAITTGNGGLLFFHNWNYGLNQAGTAWDRIRERNGSLATIGVFTAADGASNAFQGLLISDGATNPVAPLQVSPFYFNPTTSLWDRVRGNATGGAFIQGPGATGVVITGNPNLIGGMEPSASNLQPLLLSSAGAGVARLLATTNNGSSPTETEQITHLGNTGAFAANGPTVVPMGATSLSGTGSAQPFPACEKNALFSAQAIGAGASVRIITNASGKVRICSISTTFVSAASNLTFQTGTGTNCGTGTATLIPLFGAPTDATPGVAPSSLITFTFPGAGLVGPTSGDVCILSSAAVNVTTLITFSNY